MCKFVFYIIFNTYLLNDDKHSSLSLTYNTLIVKTKSLLLQLTYKNLLKNNLKLDF